MRSADLVVGTEHPDDAAVLRLPGGDLLIQTVDLIAPIVNDPRTFGRIATANSISDVYAMGGRPLTAMNVVCFPSKSLPLEVLGEVLQGSIEVLQQAGCLLVGGHTVEDPEFKFGLSVSGLVEGGDTWGIDRAQVGDVLVLTKPLGTGVVNRALKLDKLSDTSSLMQQAIKSMCLLNLAGMKAGRAAGAHAATDITGFGLLGHAAQFAHASKVTFEIRRETVPTFEGVREFIAKGVIAGRSKDNADAYREMVGGVASEDEASLMFDPQTSGGMLLSLPAANVARCLEALADWPFPAQVIGRVLARGQYDAVVV